jgi:hypothetical protein
MKPQMIDLRNIPEDIIREHIIPYTYHPQSRILCEDIHNFVETNTLLHSLYTQEYPTQSEQLEWLSNDIGRYMNKDKAFMYGFVDFFINIYKRRYMLQFQTPEFLLQHIKSHYYNSYPKDIKICLAIMTPDERNIFKTGVQNRIYF